MEIFHSLQCLKIIRHPNVLSFVGASTTPAELRVIVARAKPLLLVLSELHPQARSILNLRQLNFT